MAPATSGLPGLGDNAAAILVYPDKFAGGIYTPTREGLEAHQFAQFRISEGMLMEHLLETKGIRKTFGATLASNNIDFYVDKNEIIGLLGANGAGKTTFTRIICGSYRADNGNLIFNGNDIDLSNYSPAVAFDRGIRMVYQELSLCGNLSVYENFYVEQHNSYSRIRNWRKKVAADTKRVLDEIFPENGIDIYAIVDSLPITQQQMVEIGRAVCTSDLKLLVLDEPTSSLGAKETAQLLAYTQVLKKKGIAVVFITHRISEVMSIADRYYVFANGSNIWNGAHETANEEKLVSLISGATMQSGSGKQTRYTGTEKNDNVFVKMKGFNSKILHNIDFSASGSEIIGVAGLEGGGQVDFLKEIFLSSHAPKGSLESRGKISYVTGDRKKEGIFPGWSVLHNINMTAISRFRLFSPLNAGYLRQKASQLFDKLGIIGESIDAGITSLSGGNQQKTLVARALADDSDILILNDLTRGVDIATKKQIYGILKEAADAGKLIIWYSSDDEELELCSRVLVFRYGHIVNELVDDEIVKKNIIRTSFEGESLINRDSVEGRKKFGLLMKASIPLAAMVLVFGVSAMLQHEVLSRFGINLLIGGAVPLIFATYAQMYILGLSHVDLSVGPFMGLINVLCATWLHDNPPIGVLAIMVAMGLYACMGLIIYYRKVPAIIVTLGMSFVWLGMAYTIQARPGGEAPMWLVNIFDLNVPLIPLSVLIAVGGALISFMVYRSRYGTVIRGFGNNTSSMERSGWSNMKAYFLTYLLAAMFVTFGGFTVTAQSFASDANATASYTLLTIASVVVGGGSLLGGIVSPFGALFGALTLSMIGSLLGFLNINSDYVTMVQGLLLLSALALRLLRKEARI